MVALVEDSNGFQQPTKPSKPIKQIEYEIEETAIGERKIFRHDDGSVYKEYRSYAEIFDYPLVSIVSGRHPKTKRQGHARGLVAIGPRASGVIAIGQFCQGYFAIGQFAVARVAAIGQFTLAPIGIGQMGIFAIGIAQLGIGGWGLLQQGLVFVGGVGQQVTEVESLLSWMFGG